MKIGDKVSFLSETGGGVIAGFQGKNIVLVEDEDGFQIPTPINEVVVIGNDDYSIAKVVAKTESKPKDNKSVKALLADGTDSDVDTDVEDVDIADKEVTFKMPAEERKGGNMLSCYLAFVPINIKEMTTTRFEAYLVNDCNYCLQYSFMTAEGNAWTLHSQGEIEPNTSLYIEEVGREELNSLLKMGFQLFAYKRDKSFILKPVVEVQLRLDPVKFYKLHSFQKTIYFDTPALLYTIVEDDKIAHPLHIDAAELKTRWQATLNLPVWCLAKILPPSHSLHRVRAIATNWLSTCTLTLFSTALQACPMPISSTIRLASSRKCWINTAPRRARRLSLSMARARACCVIPSSIGSITNIRDTSIRMLHSRSMVMERLR